jgi:hypothetical protein
MCCAKETLRKIVKILDIFTYFTRPLARQFCATHLSSSTYVFSPQPPKKEDRSKMLSSFLSLTSTVVSMWDGVRCIRCYDVERTTCHGDVQGRGRSAPNHGPRHRSAMFRMEGFLESKKKKAIMCDYMCKCECMYQTIVGRTGIVVVGVNHMSLYSAYSESSFNRLHECFVFRFR